MIINSATTTEATIDVNYLELKFGLNSDMERLDKSAFENTTIALRRNETTVRVPSAGEESEHMLLSLMIRG